MISRLPPGEYRLCAIGILPSQLRSCEWNGVYSPVAVSAAQQAASQVLKLRTGTVLKVQVEDPDGRIAAAGKYGFFVGVMSTTGYFKRMEMVSSTATRRLYRLAVPHSTALRLWIDTRLTVVDQRNALVPTGRSGLAVQVSSQSELTVTLRIQ